MDRFKVSTPSLGTLAPSGRTLETHPHWVSPLSEEGLKRYQGLVERKEVSVFRLHGRVSVNLTSPEFHRGLLVTSDLSSFGLNERETVCYTRGLTSPRVVLCAMSVFTTDFL